MTLKIDEIRLALAKEDTLPWTLTQRDGRAWYIRGRNCFSMPVPRRGIGEMIALMADSVPKLCDEVELQALAIAELEMVVAMQEGRIEALRAWITSLDGLAEKSGPQSML